MAILGRAGVAASATCDEAPAASRDAEPETGALAVLARPLNVSRLVRNPGEASEMALTAYAFEDIVDHAVGR